MNKQQAIVDAQRSYIWAKHGNHKSKSGMIKLKRLASQAEKYQKSIPNYCQVMVVIPFQMCP